MKLPSISRLAFLCLLFLTPVTTSRAAPLVVAPAVAPYISLDSHGFTVNGKRTVILAGSVQYQRIDRGDWDRVLGLFERSGFNTVDVYVPWNEHEPVEGRFDFTTGNLDLAHYLALCRAHHLFVILRPGPYICNEWDGGGLPAWLYTQNSVQLRQNNPAFVSAVVRYLHEVDRVIEPYQITRGGPILCYQIENELDYFGCRDRAGYMSALRDAVRGDGITVPIVACVGSNNHITAATGDVDDVFPTDNLYIGGDIEAKVRAAALALHAHSTRGGQSLSEDPLYVSETGRDPLLLRRMLAGGAKGVSPFNFAGGINWNRANGTTEWNGSNPIASAVDFGGMIAFDAQPVPRFTATARMAAAVNTFAPDLAESDSVESGPETFTASNPALGTESRKGGPGGLFALKHGDEQFLFVLNNTPQPQETQVTTAGVTFPQQSHLTLAPWSDPILPVHVSLQPWNAPVRIDYSTAEVRHLERTAGGIHITLGAPAASDVELALSSPKAGSAPSILVWKTGENREPRTLTMGGVKMELRVETDAPPTPPMPGASAAVDQWSSHALTPADLLGAAPQNVRAWSRLTTSSATDSAAGIPGSLEASGILRKAGWWRHTFTVADPAAYTGLQLQGASGLVTVVLNGTPLGFARGVGDTLEFPLTGALHAGPNDLLVRVEIWGHANFNNGSPPINRLGSLRGLLKPVSLVGGDAPVLTGAWTLAPDTMDSQISTQAPTVPISLPVTGKTPGQFSLLKAALSGTVQAAPDGIELTFKGRNVMAWAYLGGRLLGRLILDPRIKVAGGPDDRLYIPPSWLRQSKELALVVEGTQDPWSLDSVNASALP